jgi:hypothetical protein
MSGRFGFAPAACVLVIEILLLSVRATPAFAQLGTDERDKCKTIADAGVKAAADQTTPALATFPVVVHYMKHATEGRGPEESVARDLFPLDDVKTFFQENGQFNRVWGKKHRKVTFVLVGIETCTYSGPKIPEATAAILDDKGRAYNGSHLRLANGKKFQGLDLYVWAGIHLGGTDIQVAGFSRSVAAVKHPAVWLGPDCRQGQSLCDTKFAHEVGHFFGLCHVCFATEPEKNPDTCLQTCPLEARARQDLEPCDNPDPDKRAKFKPQLMADQDGVDLQACELSFAVDNATKILNPVH